MNSKLAPEDKNVAMYQKEKKGAEDMAYVKSGWLLRQSTILKRWKRNWFDLWSNGCLIYYSDQERQDTEDRIYMQIDCANIRVGEECKDLNPPEGKGKDCCLQIICHEGNVINLVAESADDCLAWESALQEARTKTHILAPHLLYDEAILGSAPPPYTPYDAPPAYGYDQHHGGYSVQGAQVVYTRDGQAYYAQQGAGVPPGNHIIIRERYYDHDGDLAMGMLAGAATGMALGSLFWGF
ncbi:pleckstrin homology domain-containing family B member 2 [Pelobates cultripes]|uniref:Pleckstrin homology domain-containing family B member 2 n=2 Tax=Pelobates cultripes TaxID=61616 RepID=A0AAD1RAP2_PELCU|nr:pleckstrin homology domain-containing family B member 2 [Pelobates cultripes]CAH2246666.1 pleckstrin homology domain-containing family B member 2 [Pelobates cultripes]